MVRENKETAASTAPTLDEWRALYCASDRFKELAPWEWVDDTQIFAFMEREGGDVAYCCVMGMLGEFTAMAAYLGDEGYFTYLRMRKTDDFSDRELQYIQKCLMASFGEREMLQPEDLKLVKALNLKYRGPGNWPLFRDYSPGLVPWFLSGAQARFLTDALDAGTEAGKRSRRNPTFFMGPKGKIPLLLKEGPPAAGGWKVESLSTPKRRRVQQFECIPADEIRLTKSLKPINRSNISLEVDLTYSPLMVQEGERPFYPILLIAVEPVSGFVFAASMGSPFKPGEELRDQFLSSLESQGILPKEVLYKKDSVAAMLKPSMEFLGVTMRKVRSLPACQKASRDMDRMLCRY